jgi:AcrR family transcriptional regulator
MSRRNVDAASRRKSDSDEVGETRGRILQAVRSMLREGRFHSASMEEIADEADLSRAGLYLYFRSRGALIDAICETLDQSPELRSLHELVGSGEPRESLYRIIEVNARFWASDEPMFRQLYGSAAIDDTARDFVGRQTEDRSASLSILTRRLQEAGHLRGGLRRRNAHAHLLLITSFSTYVELRRNAGLAEHAVVQTLKDIADRNVLTSQPAGGPINPRVLPPEP